MIIYYHMAIISGINLDCFSTYPAIVEIEKLIAAQKGFEPTTLPVRSQLSD